MPTSLPRVLTIAGSDSSGGAGIQADLKVMTAYSVYGQSVITSVTAQNTLGVESIHNLPTEMIVAQFHAVMHDIGCDVIKIGMLGTVETIELLRTMFLVPTYASLRVVLDPVIVASSGANLLPKAAINKLLLDLCPQAYMITPNIPEALSLLTASDRPDSYESPEKVSSLRDMSHLAKALLDYGPQYVLIKGGHRPFDTDKYPSGKKVINLLMSREGEWHWETPWSSSKMTHGTGCTLSTAIACDLAKGLSPKDAVEEALNYVHGAIDDGLHLGQGHGPLNHMYRLTSLPFVPYVLHMFIDQELMFFLADTLLTISLHIHQSSLSGPVLSSMTLSYN